MDVIAARSDMLTHVYPLLQQFNNEDLARDDWRRIFTYAWNADVSGNVGYVLRDNGRYVGFLGTLTVTRLVNSRRATFCNITSWIVDPTYRNHGLRLLLPVLKHKDWTLTALSPATQSFNLLKRLGFRELDTQMHAAPPHPNPTRWFGKRSEQIITSESDIRTQLDEVNLQIFEDHLAYPCSQAVISNAESACLFVFRKATMVKYGRNVPYCILHYVSDPGIFIQNAALAVTHMCRHEKALFVTIEPRLIDDRSVKIGKLFPIKRPHLYRSANICRTDIDNLYSELVVLGL